METTSPPFPNISVLPTERRFYNGIASVILRKAVAEYTRCKGYIDPKRWGHVRSRKRVSVFRSLRARDDEAYDGDTNARIAVMIGSGQITGSLEDVMDGIYSDSTDDLHRVNALLGCKLVDGAVLNVTERRAPSDPFRFEGIRWRATKAAWGMTTNRDVLTYERTGTIVDKRGMEVAYHVVQSIDRAEWPANALKGVKREQMCVCYLYRRDTQGFTRCFIWGEVADLHPLTQRVAEYAVAGLWLNVVRSVKCARAKQCSELIAASNSSEHSPAWSAGAMCRVCYKRARFMGGSLVQCAGCKQTACKTCARHQSIFELDRKTREPKEQRICKLCLSRVRSQTSPAPPAQRDHWDSAPVTLCAAAAPAPTEVLLTPPLARKMSRRLKYELLEPTSHAAARTQLHRFVTPSPPLCTTTHLSKPSATKASPQCHGRAVDTMSSGTSDPLDSSLQTHSDVDRACRRHEAVENLDARRTEALGEFDLDLRLDMPTDVTADSSNGNAVERTHYELVFARRSGSSDEKESFLDDLYPVRAS